MLINKLVLVNHWLHLSSASLLIGGMIFLMLILRPVLIRNNTASGMGALADEVHNRFRKYVGILIGVIIFTGIINSLDGIMAGKEAGISSEYITVIRIKVLLAIGLFIIYGVNAFLIKEKKFDTDEGCSCVINPPVYKRLLQIIALILVFTILFLVVTLKIL